ncbi:hypothetical protein WN51_03612 [Melipona quadrifasciata]|uniref:Uncharacterized protein n=1 Tax=Melipona quadrifasciata TaxID=166423 RepID=A0A0N1ITA1_9HYME|nr:hypothetical protein WN51_03612 [Melipona quadrifasciata]
MRKRVATSQCMSRKSVDLILDKQKKCRIYLVVRYVLKTRISKHTRSSNLRIDDFESNKVIFNLVQIRDSRLPTTSERFQRAAVCKAACSGSVLEAAFWIPFMSSKKYFLRHHNSKRYLTYAYISQIDQFANNRQMVIPMDSKCSATQLRMNCHTVYLGSEPRSTWNTTSRASRVHAGLSRILAQPSSSRGEVCTRGAGGLSLGAGPNPGPAPTNLHTAEMFPSEAPAAFSNENTARGGTSSGHSWFSIKCVLGPNALIPLILGIPMITIILFRHFYRYQKTMLLADRGSKIYSIPGVKSSIEKHDWKTWHCSVTCLSETAPPSNDLLFQPLGFTHSVPRKKLMGQPNSLTSSRHTSKYTTTKRPAHETFDVGRLPRYRVCTALNVKRLPTDGWSTEEQEKSSSWKFKALRKCSEHHLCNTTNIFVFSDDVLERYLRNISRKGRKLFVIYPSPYVREIPLDLRHFRKSDGEKPNERSSENSETDVIQRIPSADCSTGEASVSEGSLGQRERAVSTENSSLSESSPIQHNKNKLTFNSPEVCLSELLFLQTKIMYQGFLHQGYTQGPSLTKDAKNQNFPKNGHSVIAILPESKIICEIINLKVLPKNVRACCSYGDKISDDQNNRIHKNAAEYRKTLHDRILNLYVLRISKNSTLFHICGISYKMDRSMQWRGRQLATSDRYEDSRFYGTTSRQQHREERRVTHQKLAAAEALLRPVGCDGQIGHDRRGEASPRLMVALVRKLRKDEWKGFQVRSEREKAIVLRYVSESLPRLIQ